MLFFADLKNGNELSDKHLRSAALIIFMTFESVTLIHKYFTFLLNIRVHITIFLNPNSLINPIVNIVHHVTNVLLFASY